MLALQLARAGIVEPAGQRGNAGQPEVHMQPASRRYFGQVGYKAGHIRRLYSMMCSYMGLIDGGIECREGNID